jgi:hypothetical protein
MFSTEVNIESFSQRASLRWKKSGMEVADKDVNSLDKKRLHSMIMTANPKNFLMVYNTSSTDPTKASNQEDLKEISLQLSILKKKHDLNRDSNCQHDENIAKLKKTLQSYQKEQEKALNTIEKLKKEVNRLEESMQGIKDKQDNALSATKIYNHIIERLKINKLKLEEKKELIIKSINSNTKLFTEELEICRKQKESKIKTKRALDALENFIGKETKDKVDMVEEIEKDVRRKQENSDKREERYKRQIEIAETAANEDREMRATQMREEVIVHKFWYFYMKKKLEDDMQKYEYIEKAFEKVRKNCSINSTSEMVTKVLTTEIAFNELKRIVENSNLNIINTQEKIQDIEKSLENIQKNNLKIDNKNILSDKLVEALKTAAEDKNKLLTLKYIHEKISLWSIKALKKFDCEEFSGNLTSRILLLKSKLSEVLKAIKIQVI